MKWVLVYTGLVYALVDLHRLIGFDGFAHVAANGLIGALVAFVILSLLGVCLFVFRGFKEALP